MQELNEVTSNAIEGGCRCGAVRYSLAVDKLPRGYACHCHQCQRWSGSAFSLQVMVPESVLIVRGELTLYELTTADRTSRQRFCAACHGRIFNTNTRRPGLAVLRAGTLDRSEELECALHIYVAYRQRWFQLPSDVPSYPEMAPPEAFMEALSKQ